MPLTCFGCGLTFNGEAAADGLFESFEYDKASLDSDGVAVFMFLFCDREKSVLLGVAAHATIAVSSTMAASFDFDGIVETLRPFCSGFNEAISIAVSVSALIVLVDEFLVLTLLRAFCSAIHCALAATSLETVSVSIKLTILLASRIG